VGVEDFLGRPAPEALGQGAEGYVGAASANGDEPGVGHGLGVRDPGAQGGPALSDHALDQTWKQQQCHQWSIKVLPVYEFAISWISLQNILYFLCDKSWDLGYFLGYKKSGVIDIDSDSDISIDRNIMEDG
jgi:hypothetical protein